MSYREKAEQALQKAYEWGVGGGHQECRALTQVAEVYMAWEQERETIVWINDEEDEEDDGE